jgi:type IV secretion system protein VirD4
MDPKCENFNLTADFRRKRFGHRIVRLDPALLAGPGADSFNPLAFIDVAAPDFLDSCRDVAAMLIKRQGTEPDPFWNDAAELVLTCEIAYICACEPDPAQKSLQTVRKIVSSRDRFTRSIDAMRQEHNEVVRQCGHQLGWLADKELNSVLSSVGRHTAWIDSPAMADCMTANSFDPRLLRSGKLSVFLAMPPERLAGTWAPLMRLWLGSIIRIVSRQGADERREILFLLDEVGQLGRMQALEDATTIMRGYGIRLWFIFQSLQQVYSCYGDKADVLLENIATQQFFAVTQYKTAEEISKRLGDHTIAMITYNDNRGESTQTGSGQTPRTSSHSSSSGSNTSQLGRRVLKPEEILTLPEDTALIAHRNMSFIPAKLLKYYNAPEFKGRGTGKRRGLGLRAGIAAAVMLFIGGVFAKFTNELPMPGTPGRPGRPRAYADGFWQGYGTPFPASDEYFGFPELEPVRYRRNGPSIFPELDPVYYDPGR